MEYDDNNVFAKILRGEIPNDTVYEDDHVLAFNDLYPKSDIHVIVIPKGKYQNFIDFNSNATEKEIVAFYKEVSNLAKEKGLELGCQILSNCGKDGGQDVPHFHIHLLKGKTLKF